jgi:hypothetical protein
LNERTGGQTAVGVTSVVFGLMGIALSALLFAFGPALEADMARPHDVAGTFAMKLPSSDALSMSLEIGMLAAWIALVFTGFGVLRVASWSMQACIVCGAALCFLSLAKILEGGFSYIALGFALYGGVLAGGSVRAEWRLAIAAARSTRDVDHIAVDADTADRQAA